MSVLISTAFVTGCSTSAPFASTENGPCTTEQSKAVFEHISKQIAALEDENFELAFSFAANSFQEDITLDSFTATIKTQYPMLIQNTGLEFKRCEILDSEVLQIVEVKSPQNIFTLNYVLTLENEKLGIVAAFIASITDATTI